MKPIRLFTPGPTPLPEAVLRALSLPMIHHRSEEFGEILQSVRKRLKWLCQTDGEVLVLTSSGSGGMEASVASLFAPGDEVVIVCAGKFGERWVELAKHYRLRPVVVTAEWGRAVTEEAVFAAVTKQTKGILTQACESSTGAYHPIEKIGRTLAARDDILFVVDAITALGIHDIDMVRDRIDVLIGASQKALMSPAGLATVALSSRAVSRILPEGQSYYFSLKREFKAQLKGQTGFTPAISIVRALDVALEMIEKEGKKALFERHAQMQGTARRAFVDMGLALFNPDAVATKGITVAVSPKGMDTKAWIKKLRKSEGLWLAGGQGELEGKIFRLSHMGACWAEDLAWALDTIRKHLP